MPIGRAKPGRDASPRRPQGNAVTRGPAAGSGTPPYPEIARHACESNLALLNAVIAALSPDLLDIPSPRLDIARPEKGVGKKRVGRV